MIDIAISIPSITSITNVRYSKKVVSSLQGGMMDGHLSHSKYQDEYIIKMKIVCYNIRKYQYVYVILHIRLNNKNKLNI